MQNRKQAAFTLIEVLIALAVIGIAMAAAVRASITVADGTSDLKRRLTAGWVAQNRLSLHLSRNQFPNTGRNEGTEIQANLPFTWREDVSDTPNRAFRRVEVKVYYGAEREHADAVLVGYVANVNL